MIIGITGVFGSGKTTVSSEFSKLGFKVINADKIGHKLLNQTKIKNKAIKLFGRSILTRGKIDRRKLKDIVFYDKDELIKLNKIIHPEIVKEIKAIIKRSNNKDIVVDGALLVEAGFKADFMVVVKVNKENQMKRLLKKGKYNKQEINNIIKSQMPQNKKLRYADFVIDNNKSIKDLRAKVTNLVSQLDEIQK